MFKDSASYLDEWIRFHLLVGFDHFYLYNNGSTDEFGDVLAPYVQDRTVTLVDWPGIAQMKAALGHCLETHRDETRWMAFLDDDEFLFPNHGDTLPPVLKEYENYAGVSAAWLLFGSSGQEKRTPGLVTERFHRRAVPNKHGKCVVNPRKIAGVFCLGHAWHCQPGEVIVDEKFEPLDGLFVPNPTCDVLCLNHYISKSFEEMHARRLRLPPCRDEVIYTYEQYVESDRQFNEIEDRRIDRFVRQLKRTPDRALARAVGAPAAVLAADA